MAAANMAMCGTVYHIDGNVDDSEYVHVRYRMRYSGSGEAVAAAEITVSRTA